MAGLPGLRLPLPGFEADRSERLLRLGFRSFSEIFSREREEEEDKAC